jgi:hypothetical protein
MRSFALMGPLHMVRSWDLVQLNEFWAKLFAACKLGPGGDSDDPDERSAAARARAATLSGALGLDHELSAAEKVAGEVTLRAHVAAIDLTST